MTQTPQNSVADDGTIESRYQRAMRLVQGMYNNKIVRNDILPQTYFNNHSVMF